MKQQWIGWVALAVLLLAPAPAASGAEPLTLKTDVLEVSVDPASGHFSLTALPAGKVFVKDGQLSASGGEGMIQNAEILPLGKGQMITVRYPNGNVDGVMLVPGVPFAFFISKFLNKTNDPIVIDRVSSVKAPLDLGLPIEALSVLGTGGLARLEGGKLSVVKGSEAPRKARASSKKKKAAAPTTAAKKEKKEAAPKALETPKPSFGVPPTAPGDEAGSYVWMAVADPKTRAGVVGAWVTEERGSGIVFPRVGDGKITLEAQIQFGRLRLAAGASKPNEIFALGYFADTRLGLEAWADQVAKVYEIKLPSQPVGYCTWYMEKNGGACDPEHLKELAEVAAKKLKPFGFRFIQIDDGWQAGIKKNGPKKNFNDVDPKAKYAAGMKPVAQSIEALGMAPGIWFMPFAGNWEDPFFADKTDLFVKHANGQPYDTSWGGTCLDMSNPKTREYLTKMVRRIADEWGYTLFKMDGMWTGTATQQIYVNNGYKEDGMGDAVLHDPEMTNIQAYRTGIKTVREAAGPRIFLLGCCVSQNMRSFGGAFGLVDAFRIGPDTGSGHIGSPHASRNYFVHGRIWYNDPDCVSVRARYPLGNARANASFTAISGNLYYNSDWIPDLPEERLDILKRTMLPHNLKARPVDIFEQQVSRIWLLTDERGSVRRDVVALFNWDTQSSATVEATLEHIGLDPKQEYVAFDFWENKFLGTLKDRIAMNVGADSCVILALRPVSKAPQLLSTSFHVTQGMVDVTDEKWDAAAKTLSGASKLVAGDPYELRLALPTGCKVKAAKAEGLEATVKEEAGLARVSFTAPDSKTVKWTVSFE